MYGEEDLLVEGYSSFGYVFLINNKSTEIIRYAGCGLLSPALGMSAFFTDRRSTYVAARMDIDEYVATTDFILLEKIHTRISFTMLLPWSGTS